MVQVDTGPRVRRLRPAAAVIVAVGLATATVAGAAVVRGRDGSAGPPRESIEATTVEYREPLPTPEATAPGVETHVTLATPEADSGLKEADLEMHGVFRAIPSNYYGPLTYENVDLGNLGPAADTIEESSLSPLFVAEVPGLPGGFELFRATTRGGGINNSMQQTYFDERGAQIQVSRGRPGRLPIDVPYALSALKEGASLEFVKLGAADAYVWKMPAIERVDVVFFDQGSGVLTHVSGDLVPADVILAIAQQLAHRGA